jgi:hypothetical protein
MAVVEAPAPLRALEARTPDVFEKCRKYTTAKEVMAAGLYPYFQVVESEQSPEVMVEGRKMIMLGSNNYLGLTNHPKVKEAAIEAVKKYGTGCAGTRFLNGTLDIHVQLEDKLASFFRKECAHFSPVSNQPRIISSPPKADVHNDKDHASIDA